MSSPVARTELQQLIDHGLLKPGDELHTDASEAVAVVVEDGLRLGKQIYDNPTAAMHAITSQASAMPSNGWLFWQLPDPLRGYIKPLEHLRVALKARTHAGQRKTSLSHPLRVDLLPVGTLPGCIGMTLCPGKQGDGLYGGTWARDLQQDLEAICALKTGLLITLLEPHEFELLGVTALGSTCGQLGLAWQWLQVRDSDVPDAQAESLWPALSLQIRNTLAAGQQVVIHCRGGLGRTGVIAARFLIDRGATATEAIAAVRAARSGAIETWAQEQHVIAYAARVR